MNNITQQEKEERKSAFDGTRPFKAQGIEKQGQKTEFN
jgi:hypothetical protein